MYIIYVHYNIERVDIQEFIDRNSEACNLIKPVYSPGIYIHP